MMFVMRSRCWFIWTTRRRAAAGRGSFNNTGHKHNKEISDGFFICPRTEIGLQQSPIPHGQNDTDTVRSVTTENLRST